MMRCGRWLAVAVITLQLLPAPTSRAADRGSEPGAWIPWRVEVKGGGVVAKAWERQLQAIGTVIQAAPVFGEIRGYFPLLLLQAGPPANGRGPWNGHVALEIWWPWAVERTQGGEPKVKAKFEFNRPRGFWININSRGDLSHWTWWEDREGRFYLLPETRREIAGFPVVGDRMFITRSGKPPLFDPLPQERALRWVIGDLRRQAKADEDGLAAARRAYEQFISPAGLERRRREIEAAAASQKKPEHQALERRTAEVRDRRREQDLREAATPKAGSLGAVTTERLAAHEARLAGLSAAERTEPAWIKREPKVRGAAGEIVPPNTPGGRPLVVLSPFFDPSLPPEAMQLVTVPYQLEDLVKSGTGQGPEVRVPFAVVEQTDWREVMKMLR